MTYQVELTPLVRRNLRRYRSMRKQIQRHVNQVLDDPYRNTERLGQTPGGLDLRGCRSIRVTRNFRIIYVVCGECRRVPECQFCFCEGLPGVSSVSAKDCRTRLWSSSLSVRTSGPTPCERNH
jgi:mRNA-degrading endonuclease RelE of RelBE toxin-antitoxin system